MSVWSWTVVMLVFLASPMLLVFVLIRSAPMWDEDFRSMKDEEDDDQAR